jgi:HEAT repeat protein/cyclophilin family peptidyl-prolyl cis-trans isomerase
MMSSLKYPLTAVAVGLLAGCASAPVAAPTSAPSAPVLPFEQKMGWILRLEEDRLLESAEPPAPAPPPPPVQPAGRGKPIVLPPAAPPPPRPSLLTLLGDREARIRRRAALAVGRTRLPEGVPALVPLLSGDGEPEVRQMAAFALGLLGQSSAAEPLVAALSDAEPLVQGRAAEALGLLAHKAAAGAIAAMMSAHTKTGALEGIAADDLEYPKSAPAEAVRLGTYALVRLGAYDALASALLDSNGRPISRWWPVAYAFRRINDPRAGPVLLTLLESDGVLTRAFAARGLGVVKEMRAVEPLMSLATNVKEVANVRIEAVRSLADLAAPAAADRLHRIITSQAEDPNLRLEAVTALGALRHSASTEVLVDLLTDPWSSMRGAAFIALARTDSDMFLTAISGLDTDREWMVRAALATALGSLGVDRAQPRLLEMLKDDDQRVIPAVLASLVAVGSPAAEATLIARLEADDAVVRQAAAGGLSRLKSRKAVQPLLKAYERAEKDPTCVARAAILAAVVELDREAARPLLDRGLRDFDWALRVRAAALLKTVDPTADVAQAIRPAPPIGPRELNELRPMINPAFSPVAYIDTSKGMIQVELAVLDAPRAVANFVSLVRRNFLGATPIHRVVPNFVVQDGDPRGDGEGGPGYTIRDEINQRPYLRGTVGMALDWEDTGGSQFFITHGPQPHLDGRYTVFGRVTEGMDVVDRLQQWDQIRSVRVWDGTNWIGQ